MPSWALVRKARSAGRPMTADFAGSLRCPAGIHSRAPISACPVPSGTYARCTVLISLATVPAQPRYCRCTPGGAACGLELAGFVDRADGQAAPPPGPAGGLIQPGYGEPAYHRHRRGRVPDRAAEQPPGLIRRAICYLRGDGPPVAPGDLAHHRGGVPARLQPRLGPRQAWPQQFQQLSAFPARQRGAYAGGSSRRRPCCPHQRMTGRRLRLERPLPSRPGPGQSPDGCRG
jgi:hypothetical protein